MLTLLYTAQAFLKMSLITMLSVIIFSSTLMIDWSTACMRTEIIDKEKSWACWNFNKSAGYTTRDMCCSGTACECNETGTYTTNARFGRDCKCNNSTHTFADEYYARIAERQQQQRDNITTLPVEV